MKNCGPEREEVLQEILPRLLAHGGCLRGGGGGTGGGEDKRGGLAHTGFQMLGSNGTCNCSRVDTILLGP